MHQVEQRLVEIKGKVDAVHEVIAEQRGFRLAMRSVGHAALDGAVC